LRDFGGGSGGDFASQFIYGKYSTPIIFSEKFFEMMLSALANQRIESSDSSIL
jgi:hypothetical protein